MYKPKTNQEGKELKDPRHLYTNPYSPSTCSLKASAIYLECRPT
ncbi:hypothetical protein F443_09266 [Phytophthora nicotianae P1569]|uniref:Uncharacterized protein n=2 Tax=Phytophthora nicotianae TaxID=4792 RepID=V9F5I7_PHYNI|nr:hypothetical protein F443_09266 [Phytophthora nicotianae P1569]ETO75018.1 hypothetical protein F444_09350 [Phytophthora nicotianae P1976]